MNRVNMAGTSFSKGRQGTHSRNATKHVSHIGKNDTTDQSKPDKP